jgi:hypothetical protein
MALMTALVISASECEKGDVLCEAGATALAARLRKTRAEEEEITRIFMDVRAEGVTDSEGASRGPARRTKVKQHRYEQNKCIDDNGKTLLARMCDDAF